MQPNWLPQSTIAGIQFPAIPDTQAALLLAIQFQLAQSEWWTSEQILEAQFRQISPLIAHATTSCAFYRDHYRHISLPTDNEITAETFRLLPILSRSDIQQAGEQLFSDRQPNYPEYLGHTMRVMTSGSTGQPVTVLSTPPKQLFWMAFTLRDSIWHNRDLSARFGIIKYVSDPDIGRPPHGSRLTGWGPSTDRIFPSAPSMLLNVGVPVDEQATWLQTLDPVYLLTHPSNLRALAEYFKSNSLRPPKSLAQVRTSGELLSPETRALCTEVFGVPVADIYSSQEVGYVALQCPESLNYHVQAENVLVEILDDDGNTCTPGQIGRIVITDLHNYASPLLRYAIGDYAEIGAPCACGRGLPTLTRIIGRERNMWVRPDGRKAWPLITSKKMRAAAPYKQLQLEQQRIDSIVVRLVPAGDWTSTHQHSLTSAIHDCLGFPTPLQFEIVDEIKRGRNGKFEEFICNVQ